MSPRLNLCGMQATVAAEKKDAIQNVFVAVSFLLLYQKLGLLDSVQHS
jgi:hypothetical protein